MENQSKPFSAANEELYRAIRDVYERECSLFQDGEKNVQSVEFLSTFPYWFLAGSDDRLSASERCQRERVLEAAFAERYRPQVEAALEIFFRDHAGGTPESYLLRAVDDFLNYSISRCIGLPHERERFDALYARFESDLLSDTFVFEVVAVIEGVRDHGSNFRPTTDVTFVWGSEWGKTPADTPYARDRVVPFIELKSRAHPIAHGRSLADAGTLFLLNASQRVSKGDADQSFYARVAQVTNSVVFTLRLLTRLPVFSDYRGFRVLGHLSSHGVVFMNYPDEYIEGAASCDLNLYGPAFNELIPSVMSTPYSAIEVIDRKIEDAARRHRVAGVGHALAEKQVDVDRLLDYCQALEALLPLPSSYSIALSAGVLLASGLDDNGETATKVFNAIRTQYNLRNKVMHGRIVKVTSGPDKDRLDVPELQRIVHELAILKVLNVGSKLEELAEALLLKQPVKVTRLRDLIIAAIDRDRSRRGLG